MKTMQEQVNEFMGAVTQLMQVVMTVSLARNMPKGMYKPQAHAARTVRRTTVGKEVDSLEHAYKVTASDLSPRMQRVHDFIGHIMGYYDEAQAVVVEEDGRLVGIAVYGTAWNKVLGARETHIDEIVSVYPGAGIGRILIQEVERIAVEEQAGLVTLSPTPEERGFYEKLGFAYKTIYPLGEVMVKWLKPRSVRA